MSNANAFSPGGFSQASVFLPGGLNSSGWQGAGSVNISGYVLDQRTGSPTYGQQISWTIPYPQYVEFITGTSANLMAPTVNIQLAPGMKRHQIFAYFYFGSFSYSTQVMNIPVGMLNGTLSDGGYTGSQPSYGLWNGGSYNSFSGTLSGKISFWSNGGNVGQIPFTNGGTSGNVSSASLIFNTWQSTGLAISGKGGGLQVTTPFDGTARTIPCIEVDGSIDSVTVDLHANYSNASSNCGFYIGVLSTN